jgi:hypothetical protein
MSDKINQSYAWVLGKDLKELPMYQVGLYTKTLFKSKFSYNLSWILLVLFLTNTKYFIKNKKIVENFNDLLKSKWYALPIGYLTGLFYILIRDYIGNLTSILMLVNDPDIKLKNINSPNPFNINDPQVGDWMMLLKNTEYPLDDKTGYIVKLQDFIKAEKDKKIKAVELYKYLNKSCTECSGYDRSYNTQSIDYEKRYQNITKSLFYLGTLLLTFGFYIYHFEKSGVFKHGRIFFLLITLILLIILFNNFITYLSFNKPIPYYDNILSYKKQFGIIAVSWAISTILIV